jgi:uncharacterized protein (TIGR03435 family)
LCLVDANCRYESALRVPVCAFVAVAVASASLIAQPPRSDSAVRFDVASVKPSAGSTRYGISRPTNGIVRTRAAELRRLIAYAYGIDPASHEPQPEGGPDWIDKDLFEIEARDPVDMSFAEGRRMMQTLLRERFNLTVHMAKRDVPVYALVIARTDRQPGSGLVRSTIDCSRFSDILARTGRLDAAREVSADCEIRSGGGIGGGRLQMRGRGTIREFIPVIARSPDVDRPVIDGTGLTGTYEVDFVWAPARSGPGGAAAAEVVSIFSALQEQLGLKLQPRRQRKEVVMIDSVSPLIPN